MKRKISLFSMVVVLVLICTLVFVACNKDKDSGDSFNIANDYNYEQIAQKVSELVNANGIYVNLHMSSTDNGQTESYDVALGATENIVYFKGYGSEMYLDFSADTTYDMYTTIENDAGALVWNKTANIPYTNGQTKEAIIQNYQTMIYGYFGMYQYVGAGEGTKSTATVAGRSCDKYSLTRKAAGATASYEVCIDKTTGICMKWIASGSYGGESGAVTFECTEFRDSWTPTLPTPGSTTNITPQPSGGGQQGGSGEGGQQGGSGEGGQQGGSGEGGQQGGSGEVPVDSVFANKKLVATSVDCTNNTVASYFTNAHASLFMSGDFELVSGLGVLFGTYTVQDNDRYVAMTTSKGFDFEDAEYYHTIPQTLQSLSIVREENGFRLDMRVPIENSAIVDATIHMRDSGTSPMREELPNDPNGDTFSTQYQVEQSSWDYFFKDHGLLLGGTHCTIAYSSDDSYDVPGTFKIDGLKMHDDWTLMSQYYQRTGTTPDSLGCYAFNVYNQDNDNWRMASGSYELAHFNQWTGTVPVPFARLSYSGTGHYYYVSSFTYRVYGESQDREIQNFRAYFENGKLKQIQYKFQYTTYTFVYSAHNATTVTLPEVGTGGATSNSEVYALLENKVLVYNMITNNSGALDDDELALARQASQGAVLTVFEDNEIEFYLEKKFDYDRGQVVNDEYVYYGSFTLGSTSSSDSRGTYFAGTATFTEYAYGDALYENETTKNVRYYTNLNLFRINMGTYFLYLEASSGTPTHITKPAAGGSTPTLCQVSEDFGTTIALENTILALSDGAGIKMTLQITNDYGEVSTIGYWAKGGIYSATGYFDVVFDTTSSTYKEYIYDDSEDEWTCYSENIDDSTVYMGMNLSTFASYHDLEYDQGTREADTKTIDGVEYSIYRYTYEMTSEVMEIETTTGLCVYYSGYGSTWEITSLLLAEVDTPEIPNASF